MDAVFVVGLAIEVAGAGLLAAGALTLDPTTIARRGMTLTSAEEPQRDAQREFARAVVGFVLLALGVVVQLFGYAADGGWWLLVIAVEVVLIAVVIGVLVADGPVTSRLYARAVASVRKMREASASSLDAPTTDDTTTTQADDD
jgi:hypothetical protein